ncbi:MAG: NTP transferase domain-containing protein [Gammaproteobacteria bacterium]|jgi:spore coat polysaccharide biosynthesis protein SpsF|nr:NTP transferase domain-containing protein [Gammaproteobacteria bacterium]
MKIGFFITARLKSTRLKRKILLDLEGRSVLGHVIESARQVDEVDDVVVCTSTVAQDRPILDVCNKHGCYYFNGSPGDVLNRLLSASTFFECDYLLLITADNPLFSFEYAQRLVTEIKRDPEVDYLHIEGLPIGMDPYIIRRNAFEVIDAIKSDAETEFWPEYIKDQSIFKHRSIEADAGHKRDYRITLDYQQDLDLFKSVYKQCYQGRPIATSQVIEYLDANPSVSALNSSIDRSWLNQDRVNQIEDHLKNNRDKLISLKAEIYNRHNEQE